MTITLSHAARSFLNVPFRHHGRTEKALDCIGHVRQSLIACGRQVTRDVRYYSGEAYKGRLMAEVKAELGEPTATGPKADVQENDVVMLHFNGEPHHMGIIGRMPYGSLSLIHADSVLGKVVEHRFDDVWRSRIVAVWRGVV